MFPSVASEKITNDNTGDQHRDLPISRSTALKASFNIIINITIIKIVSFLAKTSTQTMQTTKTAGNTP